MAFLENWMIVVHETPGARCLLGVSYGHDVIRSGHWTCTSPVQEIDVASKIARTMNTEYALGDPLVGEIPPHVLRNLREVGLSMLT